jgi:hypothetical protein
MAAVQNIMSKTSRITKVATPAKRPAARVAIRMPTVAEDKAITAAARADPDAQPLTPKQLKAMVPRRSLRGR